MTYSRFQFDLLFRIAKNPYINQQELFQPFSKKYRFSCMLPFIVKNKGALTRLRFVSELNHFKDSGLILLTPYTKENLQNDCGTLFQDEEKVTADSTYGFLTTEKGDAIIEQYFRERLMFWIPWGVTTVIALISLFTSLWPIMVKIAVVFVKILTRL